MKKRILALTLSVLMAASLAGCSKELSNEYITIKQYDGLEVAKVETTEITDENVEKTINSKLAASATTEAVDDRAAQDGDTVNIDYKGSIDGVEFEGGSDTGSSIVLGSGRFIGANGDYKGFEEQIVGHKTGENFDITVQFPSEYERNPEMASKVAVFNVTLNGISLVTTPELTDDWVKGNSEESKTVEEYKKEVRKQLEEGNETSKEEELETSVLTALADQVEVKKYPKGAVDEQLSSIEEYYKNMASVYGVEFADFLSQYMGMTEEDFNTQAKEVAETAVKRNLACELIAKKKNLEPSDKEYEEQIKEYAENAGYEDSDAFIEQVGEDTLKSTILQKNVAKYLAEKCVQVEQTNDSANGAE